MGFTLPYKYGGLNLPCVLYTMSNDIVSRADAALMNLYGLQGIAETINNFASDDIKEQILPRMASGELTGAMVLTEPDAGSDLQSVKTQAYQDAQGNWYVNGVKRFITNGCGDILLVLCRTEPNIADARGLSCLLVEKGPKVKVRRLEHKLGINGSPTCEIVFDNAPAKLIGSRQRGLITYVMSLMNGARTGIAAQSLGIGEAAYRAARQYAAERKQFNVTIDQFPAIRELLVDMSVDLQAARSLTYFPAYCVDLEQAQERRVAADKANPESGAWRKESRHYRAFNKMLTPMAKYYSAEMSLRVANNAVSVLGGSGYMKDYPVERYLRDARITSIYEGTSQLQIVAAVAGVLGGTLKDVVEEVLAKHEWVGELADSVAKIREGLDMLVECAAFIKEQSAECYRDLYARDIVDMGEIVLIGALFADEATESGEKTKVLARWLATGIPQLKAKREKILAGATTVVDEFDTLAPYAEP